MSDSALDARQLADLADLILNAAHEIRSRDLTAGVVDLTATESTVMRVIDRNPGATPSSLAHATGLQRSNLSTALRCLEDKGFIERVPDGTDARTTRVLATALAKDNIQRLWASWAARLSEALGGQAPGLDDSIALLQRLSDGLVRVRQET